MTTLRVDARPTKRETIQQFYAALDAPAWAASNLDALADVLRDLSWLPPGRIELEWHVSPELPEADLDAIHDVLLAATAQGPTPHPLSLRVIT
jgi:hypothetical protein